jgi:hypothetical protein
MSWLRNINFGVCPPHVGFRDPPLAGDALVNQRLAVRRQHRDLALDVLANLIALGFLLLDPRNGFALHRHRR